MLWCCHCRASRLAFVGTNSLTSPVRKTEARKCKLDRYRLYDNEEAKNLDAGADDCSRADGRSVPALIFQVYVPDLWALVPRSTRVE